MSTITRVEETTWRDKPEIEVRCWKDIIYQISMVKLCPYLLKRSLRFQVQK